MERSVNALRMGAGRVTLGHDVLPDLGRIFYRGGDFGSIFSDGAVGDVGGAEPGGWGGGQLLDCANGAGGIWVASQHADGRARQSGGGWGLGFSSFAAFSG